VRVGARCRRSAAEQQRAAASSSSSSRRRHISAGRGRQKQQWQREKRRRWRWRCWRARGGRRGAKARWRCALIWREKAAERRRHTLLKKHTRSRHEGPARWRWRHQTMPSSPSVTRRCHTRRSPRYATASPAAPPSSARNAMARFTIMTIHHHHFEDGDAASRNRRHRLRCLPIYHQRLRVPRTRVDTACLLEKDTQCHERCAVEKNAKSCV